MVNTDKQKTLQKYFTATFKIKFYSKCYDGLERISKNILISTSQISMYTTTSKLIELNKKVSIYMRMCAS